MWDVVSFISLPPSSEMSESPAVCIARVLLLPSVGTWSLVHHGFCTLWTVFKTYCVTCFLLALVAPFSRGCVSALLGEYVPSFPQGVFFRVFVSGGYTSNQCQPIRRTHGLRLLIMCSSWKADWFSGLFSMIWAAFTLAFPAFLVVARLRTWGL